MRCWRSIAKELAVDPDARRELKAFRGIGAGKDRPVGVAQPDPINADFLEAEKFLLVVEQQVDRNVLG